MVAKKSSRTKSQRKKGTYQTSEKSTDKAAFWNSIIRAVEADPRDVNSIRGASGIQHPVLAAGVDETRQRLIIISRDHEARSAAMMQADIQSAFSSIHVIVAKPILMNLQGVARSVIKEPQSEESDDSLKDRFMSRLGKQMFQSELPDVDLLELSGVYQFMQAMFDINQIFEIASDNPIKSDADKIAELISIEPDKQEKVLGLCPIPIYDFSKEDFEILLSGRDIEATRAVLDRLSILQYFFPPPDNLALGIIDRAPINNSRQLINQLKQVPELGHPFGDNEIVQSKTSINDMIDELRERRLLVEGEIGFELTPEGESIRSTIRFKPREGLLSKIINRFSFNIDLKDLFRSGSNT
jgi:hypothetical protein